MKFSLLMLSLWATVATTGAAAADNKSPPPFFLQDPKDSLCLAGEDFRRCSIDTLFYVVGSPGKYQVHKRNTDGSPANTEDDGLCLSKKNCNGNDQESKILSCSHCGSKAWNILGDSETGYVLTEGSVEGSKLCLVRQYGSTGSGGTTTTAGGSNNYNKATLASCNSKSVPYTPLQLQFASESDIKAMSSPAARLMGAASDGDKKLVQQFIKDGVNVNERDWDELTAIIPASSAGQLEIVKLLIKAGADVNAADKDGITALMEASIMGHAKVVELLLSSGADVDATAKSGVTALWLAAGEGKADVMSKLLAKGASAANTRLDGITALMTASVGGHIEAIKLLLDNGADPTVSDGDGLTPLMNAAENGTVACLEALISKTPEDKLEEYVNGFSKTGFSALIISSAHGHGDAVEVLLKAGADPNAVHDDSLVTPLMYAAASGHLDVLKVLLDNPYVKVDLHALHSNGGTALLEASTGGAPEAMEMLIEAGANYNFVDLDGVTPLMAVASQGNLKGQTLILEKLKKDLDAEALLTHINMASYSGGTSIMFSAAGGHLNCTEQLIEYGADVNAIARATPEYLVKLKKMIEDGSVNPEEDPHVDGVTALHVAAQGGHLTSVMALIKAGAKVTIADDEGRTALQLAVKGNYGEVAAELVKGGADPNTPYVDEDGETHNMLMDAIIVENTVYCKLLIEKGADLYFKDERKVSTLLQASHRGLTDVVDLLLKKHAETGKDGYLNDASDEGITPLISAASEGHADVVQLLLDTKKVDMNAKDKDGTNSLMAASARGHNKVVEVLLKAGVAVNDQNSDGHTALMFAYNGKNQVETLWERYAQYVGGEEGSKKEKDETGPIIREALNNHTALVDLLMKHGADISLKDKEGHTAKDFDFHPDADADVLEKEAKAAKVRDASKNEL